MSLASLAAATVWGSTVVWVATAVNRSLTASSVAPIRPGIDAPCHSRSAWSQIAHDRCKASPCVLDITEISTNHLGRSVDAREGAGRARTPAVARRAPVVGGGALATAAVV